MTLLFATATPVTTDTAPSPLPADIDHADPRVRRRHRSLVLILGALSAFSPLAIDMYLPAFPQIAREMRAPAGAVGLTLSLFLVGLASGQALCGPLSDRFGRRPPLIVGCFAFAAASILCALAPSIELLIAARFLMGVGGSAGLVVARAVVRDWFDEEASARMFSMMMVVAGIAPVVAPTIGGLLLTRFHWQAVFWILCAFGVACGASVVAGLPESLPPTRRARGPITDVLRQYGQLLLDRRFVPPAAVLAFSYGVLFAYIAGSPFVFIELHGVSPQRFSLIFATNAVALFLGGRTNAWLLGRWHARAILRRACLANAVLGLLLVALVATSAGGIVPLAVLLFLTIGTLGFIFPNSTAVALTPFANRAGVASALLGVAQYALGAGSGALVGLLHNGTALPMAGLIAACGIVITLISLTALRSHSPRPE
jgi:DHA1 family bicyclomycin/chloramphenicol resistance-like MFS transporter